MTKVVAISPGYGEAKCELPDGEYSIGRGLNNAIVIDDHSVSLEHAKLLVYGRELIVRELGSTNGTFVNGYRVRVQSGVCNGQILCVGKVRFRVQIESEEERFCDSTHEELQAYLVREEKRKRLGAPNLPIIFTPLVREVFWEKEAIRTRVFEMRCKSE